MDITFHCGQCGQKIVIDEVGAGKVVKCPKCGSLSRAPATPTMPNETVTAAGRLVWGAILVLAITGSSARIWFWWRSVDKTSPSSLAAPTAGDSMLREIAGQNWIIENWRLSAEPVLWREAQPNFNIGRPLSTYSRPGTVAPSNLGHEQFAVRIHVDVELTGKDLVAGLWPKAVYAELLR